MRIFPRGLAAPLAVLAVGGCGLLVPRVDAMEIAPFRVALAVHWGSGAGPDAFRGDLSRTFAESLAAGCFAGVAIADENPPDTDLAYTVVLSGVVEETRFDDSIAGTLKPGDPGQELRRVAHFQVTTDATLSARSNGAIVHRKHIVTDIWRRPMYLGEDPQATARAQAIERIVDDLEKAMGCGKAKLGRKIREALGAAGPAAPVAR